MQYQLCNKHLEQFEAQGNLLLSLTFVTAAN